MTRSALLAVLLVASWGTPARCEGILADVLRGVRQPDETDDDDNTHRRTSRSHHHDCDDEDDGDNFFGTMFLAAITSPWAVPHALLEPDSGMPVDFSRFPYADGHDGYLLIESPRVGPLSGFGTRYSQEYGGGFDGVSRIGGQLQFETDSRWGIDSEWDRFSQDIPGWGRYEVWTGDANVIFRFAQSEKVQLQSGIGFNYLVDTIGSDFGFNFTYGADFFPAKPWVVSTHLDLGTIGDSSRVHLRGTLGVMLDRFEFFGGYDLERIANINLHGPLFGFRIWW